MDRRAHSVLPDLPRGHPSRVCGKRNLRPTLPATGKKTPDGSVTISVEAEECLTLEDADAFIVPFHPQPHLARIGQSFDLWDRLTDIVVRVGGDC